MLILYFRDNWAEREKSWSVLWCCQQHNGWHWKKDDWFSRFLFQQLGNLYLLWIIFNIIIFFNISFNVNHLDSIRSIILIPEKQNAEKETRNFTKDIKSPPSERGNDPYIQWLSKIKKSACAIHRQDTRMFYITMIEYLIVSSIFLWSLCLNLLCLILVQQFMKLIFAANTSIG